MTRLRAIGIFVCVALCWIGPAQAQSALDAVSGNWPEAGLRISLDGHESRQVEIDQLLAFRMQSNASGYVLLAHINADGDLSLLFPGALTRSSDPNMSAGTDLLFPDPNSNLQLEAQLPIGDESIYAVLTETPITSASFGDPEGELFIGQSRSVSLEDQLVNLIGRQQETGRVAVSKLQYEIVPLSGDVQFTTRAIERYFGEPPPVEPPGGRERKAIPLRIQFEFDSAQLTDSARRDLDVFGEALTGETLSGRPFTIAGHTDSVGSDEYNLHLSGLRANAVIEYLVDEHDVDGSTLTAAAFGESQPRRDNQTEEGRRENRRVEFIQR